MDKFKLRVQQVETKYSIYDDKASEPATRHPPNAEDDKLWFEWDKLRVIAITREELVRLGRDPETAVRFPSDVGGRGTELYAAGLDAHHYLHCLNRIRQQVYFVYYGQEQARHNCEDYLPCHHGKQTLTQSAPGRDRRGRHPA